MHFPHEMYKADVYRCVWSVEEVALYEKSGWDHDRLPGVEYKPITATGLAEPKPGLAMLAEKKPVAETLAAPKK